LTGQFLERWKQVGPPQAGNVGRRGNHGAGRKSWAWRKQNLDLRRVSKQTTVQRVIPKSGAPLIPLEVMTPPCLYDREAKATQ